MSEDSQARKPENPARNNGEGRGSRESRSGSYPQKSGSYLPDIHRTLPQSLDAEKGLLCSALLSPNGVMVDCAERIGPNHFYHPPHQTIYEVMVQQWKDSKPVDFITLTQILDDHDQLEACGGPATISELFTFVPTATNATFYLEIVREKFLLRSMIAACTEAASRCYEEQGEVKVLLDDVEKAVMAIGEDRFKGNLPDMRTMILSAIDEIETLYKNKGGLTGLSTGFKQLDQMTGGMRGAEMFVIAARPSMGKTAFSMNIAEHVAVTSQKSVAVFSLEMSSSQLVQRLLCSCARVNLARIRDGFLSRADSEKIGQAAKLLIESRIFIDDTPGITVLELRAKARRLQAQHGIELIVIDYLQLLRSSSKRAQENRQIEIAEISSGIKALAKELNIPVIVLAQLNRNPESRTGASKGRPRISDLRESGSIEQDADIVGLLVRSEVYEDDDEAKQEKAGEAELIIAKQRNGPTGDIPLTFLKEYTRFEDRAEIRGES